MNTAKTFFVWFATPLLCVVVACLASRAAQTSNPAPSQSRSVLDGVYTAKQAQRGEALFRRTCASCHGDNLAGKETESTPPLVGQAFEKQWKGHSVGEMFKKILRKMPQDDPGTLTPPQTADLVAFVLSFNKYPASQAELPSQEEMLAGIRFEAQAQEQKKSPAQAP